MFKAATIVVGALCFMAGRDCGYTAGLDRGIGLRRQSGERLIGAGTSESPYDIVGVTAGDGLSPCVTGRLQIGNSMLLPNCGGIISGGH